MYANIIKKKIAIRTLQTREIKKFPLFPEQNYVQLCITMYVIIMYNYVLCYKGGK